MGLQNPLSSSERFRNIGTAFGKICDHRRGTLNLMTAPPSGSMIFWTVLARLCDNQSDDEIGEESWKYLVT